MGSSTNTRSLYIESGSDATAPPRSTGLADPWCSRLESQVCGAVPGRDDPAERELKPTEAQVVASRDCSCALRSVQPNYESCMVSLERISSASVTGIVIRSPRVHSHSSLTRRPR